jgi:hypothetical protein
MIGTAVGWRSGVPRGTFPPRTSPHLNIPYPAD